MTNRALFIASLSAAALTGGAALAEQQTYDLSGFDAVSVSAGVEAQITVGGDYSVRAESTPEGLERLEIRVRGGELDIGRDSKFFDWGKQARVTVYVTLPEMKALGTSSGSSATAAGVKAAGFSLDASSGSSADVDGSCDSLSLDVSSGARIDAEQLQCKSASADASSGASARIFASESIVADASSGGSIRVYGGPKNVNTDTSSGGSVRIER